MFANSRRLNLVASLPASAASSAAWRLPDPIGYADSMALSRASTPQIQTDRPTAALAGKSPTELTERSNKIVTLKKKRAMEMARAPGSALFMTGFMMWMSGNSLQIFSIMIVGMALFQPLQALTKVDEYFVSLSGKEDPPEERIDLLIPKLTYVALNLVGLGMALYKCNAMGLIPASSADWINLLEPRWFVESSGGGVAFF